MHGEAPGRPHLAGMGTREETIALWGEVTGISTADIEWYEGFAAFKLSCLSVRMSGLGRGEIPPGDWPDTPMNRALVRKVGLTWPGE